jgi:DNA adenine methylase
MNCVPFLRWPGGKRWLAHRLAHLLAERLHEENTYIEPFVGAGAMYFALQPKRAILGDTNHALIETYAVVRDQPDYLAEKLLELPVTKEVYYEMRKTVPKDPLNRAVRFIYLNRTCYGGIPRTNQEGVFNVPFGGGERNAKFLIEQGILQKAAGCLRETELELLSADFEESIQRANVGDVIYCDPCYRGVSRVGYDRYGPKIYSWEDQLRLASIVLKAYQKGVLAVLSTQTTEGFEDLLALGTLVSLCRRPGLTQPLKKQTGREILLILDPNGNGPRWESLNSPDGRLPFE